MEIDQTYEVVRIDGDHDPLKEHPQNPNRGHEESIDESIEHNGWFGALTVQKSTGYILVGNHRYRVAKKRSAREIPVIWRDVDDETALRILLADNQTAKLGYIDEEALTAILEDLQDLSGTGYGDALHPLEKQIESERVDSGGGDDSTDADGQVEDAPSSEGDLPDPDDIPDDVYTPQFGIMLVVESEQQQAALYAWLQSYVEAPESTMEEFDNVKMRVVAV